MIPQEQIKLGNPPGAIIDISDILEINVLSEQSEKSFLGCFDKVLPDRELIHLCLSGGLDSQFTLRCCLELNRKVIAYTYRAFWEDTIVNTEDVYLATELCKKYKVEHKIIDIDLLSFYENLTYIKYSADFFNRSPQLAVHFYFIEKLKNEYNIDHILLGGDPPLIRFYPKLWTKDSVLDRNIRITNETFFRNNLIPYYKFCKSIGIECYRDIFYHSPEMVYSSYLNNLETVKKANVYLEHNDNVGKNNCYRFKYEYYKNIIPDLLTQKSETNGFENLKKMFAQKTGIYDQFNILYRQPLLNANSDIPWLAEGGLTSTMSSSIYSHSSTKWEDKKKNKVFISFKHDKNINKIYSDFCDFVLENNLEPVNQYSFDF